MKTLHFDCFSGISGDMTLAALIDAGVDAEAVRQALDSLGLPIKFHAEKIRKGGFAATQVKIEAPHEHKHRHLHHIEEILSKGKLSKSQRELALKIFRRLAEAEAEAHGMAIEKVHFHEVGALDSIADITGAAVALDLLAAEYVTSTPVPTGNGAVQCEHGLMPIPAPGTAALLKGVPLRPSSIQAELTTPTGAAILTTIVQEWTASPAITVRHIGCGAGQKDFAEQPNILRVMIGESGMPSKGYETDTVHVLETNLDDISAEIIGHCFNQLLKAGAVDVFTTPICMKKNRPGVLLTVLAPEEKLAVVEEIIFRETGTLGVRCHTATRHKLHRRAHTVETTWGPVQGKLAWRANEPPVFSPEYEDCAKIARAYDVALRDVYDAAKKEYQQE